MVFRDLIEQGAIAIRPAEFLDSVPAPLPDDLSFSRIEGMLLGLAVGDSLGVTSEGLAPVNRRNLYGEIRDYLPLPRTGKREGVPSDDTQLAFWTLEQMLEEYDFKRARRGAAVLSRAGKTRITIRLYNEVLAWFKKLVHDAGGGSYQRLINEALREHISRAEEPLEDTLRRVLREELYPTG